MKQYIDKMKALKESSAKTSEKDLPWNAANARSFVIITAENPMAKELSQQENRELQASLLAKLEEDGKKFVVQKGKYGNEENPVVIFDVPDDYGKDLAKMYMQESFIYGERSDSGFTYYMIGIEDSFDTMVANSVTMFDQRPADYWSDWNGVIYSIDF